MPDRSAPDVLQAIVAAARHIVEVRRSEQPEPVLEREALNMPGNDGVFRRAISTGPAPRIIAECKRRSPARGLLRKDYDPAAIASSYERHGAAAISVLTEPTFFDGAPRHLRAVRDVVSLPLLRKDFVVDRYQLLEARAWGAEAVLLIVAALDARQLPALVSEARRLQLEPLVEVHDARELDRAIGAGAEMIGINNRNLKTLDVSVGLSEQLAERLPPGVLAVAESGLKTPEDLSRLARAGFDAFLIGERLMAAPDPGAALEEMRSWQPA
jgi:indole-3-glycerol phosphate synthase